MIHTADFLAWLRAQQNAAYVWGAQGQEACADGSLRRGDKRLSASWQAWVDARETSEANANRAKAAIQQRLDAGKASVPLYDCSGLVMCYLQNITACFERDMRAQDLFAACEPIPKGALAPGCLVFCHNGRQAHHVGVYLGETLVIEAQGRNEGVVIRPLDAGGGAYWNRFGILPCLLPEEGAGTARFARCTGGSVYVRKGPGTAHVVVCLAHQGDRLLVMPAQSPGWREVALRARGGFVTGYMSAEYIAITEEAYR